MWLSWGVRVPGILVEPRSHTTEAAPPSPLSVTLTQCLEELLEEDGWLCSEEEPHTTDWEGLTDLFGGLFEEPTTDWEGLSALFSGLFDEPVQEQAAEADAPVVVNLTAMSEDELVNLTASPDEEGPTSRRPILPVRGCGFDDDDMDPWSEGERAGDEEV